MLTAKKLGWTETDIARYHTAGYWRRETMNTFLCSLAEQHGTATALIDCNVSLSYTNLLEQSSKLASSLAELGLRAGDHAVVQLPNSWQFVITLFALSRLGVCPVLALPAHRLTEISAFAASVRARIYFCADIVSNFDYRTLARKLQVAVPSTEFVVVSGNAQEFLCLEQLIDAGTAEKLPMDVVTPESLFCFLLSGGTTNIPKLIPRLHCDYLCCARYCMLASEMNRDTRSLISLPAAHNFPLCAPGLLGTLMAGGTIVMASSPEPTACFDLIDLHRITHTALVPPAAILWCDMAELLERQHSFPSISLIQLGGARVSSELVIRTAAIFDCTIQNIFGMSEGLISTTRHTMPDRAIAESQGIPVCPADEYRIVDAENRPVPIEVSGSLQIRGPYTIKAYYNNPLANQTSFTQDGFFCTGDNARQTQEGWLVIEGREKDQIQRCGEKIIPEEIENLLVTFKGVRDAVLTGVGDNILGERCCAFIFVHEKQSDYITERKLRNYLHKLGVASFKIPDQFIFVTTLPATAVGKNNRKKLRESLLKEYNSYIEHK